MGRGAARVRGQKQQRDEGLQQKQLFRAEPEFRNFTQGFTNIWGLFCTPAGLTASAPSQLSIRRNIFTDEEHPDNWMMNRVRGESEEKLWFLPRFKQLDL